MGEEVINFEDRTYVDPEVSLAEQERFMEKFRGIREQNQAQINRDTYNLGTQVPSNQGGLIGAEGLWNAQYQRPQVNAAIENLRQVGLQQAINTAMQNQQNAMSNRINQAKRAYYRAQQEAYKRNSSGGGTGGNGGGGDAKKGGINATPLPEGTVAPGGTLQSSAPGTSVVRDPASSIWENVEGAPNAGVYDTATEDLITTYYPNGSSSQESVDTNYSFWDTANPLAWLSWLAGLAGTSEGVKK